jgi:6-phosphofructokinase
MRERNLLVVQGGGPTQVLNATLAAIVSEARVHRKFQRTLGTRWGMKGLVEGKAADLSPLSPNDLDLLRVTPGAALGSSRFKPVQEDLPLMLSHLQRLQVRDLLFIGGNGTMRGAEVVSQFCRESGYGAQVMGIPKTVDNDIRVTDRCPGYASAARYVAQSTRDLGMDVHSLPQPVSIFETMGRSVGWLAAASALGKKSEKDAPHLVYLPELPFDMDRFLAALDGVVAKQGWAIVVVAEGIHDAAGHLIYQTMDASQADALQRPLTGGVGQFLAETVARHLRLRCRCEKPGLLGRSSMVHVSARDMKDAELVGRGGVRALLAGETEKMVSLRPLHPSAEPGYEFVPFSEVAGLERPIPAEWISDGAIPVKDAFFQYLQPSIGSLAPYYCGMDFAEDA